LQPLRSKTVGSNQARSIFKSNITGKIQLEGSDSDGNNTKEKKAEKSKVTLTS